MSGNKFLLDTNAILYILNGDKTLTDFLFNKELYISVITEIELLSYQKLTMNEKIKIKEFIGDCKIIYLDSTISKSAIHLKRKYNLKLGDSIIAASSIIQSIPFVTSDKKFRTVEILNLVYYERE